MHEPPYHSVLFGCICFIFLCSFVRELELLDEITLCRYMGRLRETVYGPTRNALIAADHECKGTQYVPKQVHCAIRWSKRDPLIESDVYNISNTATSVQVNKTTTVTVATNQQVTNHDRTASDSTKMKKCRRLNSGSTKAQAGSLSVTVTAAIGIASASERTTKNARYRRNITAASISSRVYTRGCDPPIGMIWSQNSCAYDS